MKEDTGSSVHSEHRRLAAIMFTDIVGFSRQMGANEARTLRLLEVHNQIVQQAVSEHHGTVIKTVGDAFLVDFPSVVHAVQGAQQIQAQLHGYNAEKEPSDQIHIRIGIHLGDIVQKSGDVFGDGVNIASRLQGLAAPDTICISQAVYKEIEKKLSLGTVISLGRPHLKNIAQREPVYALLNEAPQGLRQQLHVRRLQFKQWRQTLQIAAAVLLLLWAGVVTLKSFRSIPPPGQSQEMASTESQLALPLPDKPSLVVLPFVNMSEDPKQEYFSDGLTDVLTGDLSKISSLFVIARNSAFTYKGKAVNMQDIRKELGVRYVLEGSVQKAGEQVRIVTQLIDTTTDSHLWSERYDRPLKDIFALQDEIVQKIVTTLKLQITLREQGTSVRKTTDNLEAYDAYLRGVESVNRYTKEANAQARQLFEKAIELDPQYAQAYASLGFTYFVEWGWQWNPDPQNLERAFARAQKAAALDDTLPQVHTTLGLIYLYKKQFEPAKAEFERSITLDPNFANAYVQLGSLLASAGQPQEAVRLMERGIRLNPRQPSPIQLNFLGLVYIMLGRHEEGITVLKRALSLDPNLLFAHVNLAVAYSELGRDEEARTEVATVLRLNPQFSLEGVKQTYAVKDSAQLERYLTALRRAGLK